MIKPTDKQIENAEGMGWLYIEGKNVFMKDDWVGWFTEAGWVKCFEEDFK